MLFTVTPPNYNNRIKITNINSNSSSFINKINHSYSFFCIFVYSLIFENSLNLFLYLHLAIKSCLWFNRLIGSKYNIIWIFPSRHKLHLPSKQSGVVDLFNIFHWFFGVKPLFFNFQICLHKAVWFLKRSWENDWIWLLCHNFHLTDEIPIIFLLFTFSFGKILAWYTATFKLHIPFIGESILDLLLLLLLLLLLFSSRSQYFLIISVLWVLVLKNYSCRNN